MQCAAVIACDHVVEVCSCKEVLRVHNNGSAIYTQEETRKSVRVEPTPEAGVLSRISRRMLLFAAVGDATNPTRCDERCAAEATKFVVLTRSADLRKKFVLVRRINLLHNQMKEKSEVERESGRVTWKEARKELRRGIHQPVK